jgi:hypothetical protein
MTCWYKEEFLSPFFLNHYSWVDRITIFLGDGGKYLPPDSKIKRVSLIMPQGIDDGRKRAPVNAYYKICRFDWLLILDADEFAFITREDLEKVPKEFAVAKVAFAHVYRHISEQDLDPSKPVKDQRRHGYFDPMYEKPIIARPGRNLLWRPGNHHLRQVTTVLPTIFTGAHWGNADPCFAIQRRVRDRSQRISLENLKRGYGSRQWNLTEEDVLKECRDHQNDPALW